MRVTVRTNLAMRVLMYCAVQGDALVRSGDMARACNASAHHVAQVVNRLSSQGVLQTLRGRAGGVRLARPPGEITVGEVFSRFEAGVPLIECFDAENNTCPLIDGCRLRDALRDAVTAFYRALDQVTLDELVRDNLDLEQLFAGPGCTSLDHGRRLRKDQNVA